MLGSYFGEHVREIHSAVAKAHLVLCRPAVRTSGPFQSDLSLLYRGVPTVENVLQFGGSSFAPENGIIYQKSCSSAPIVLTAVGPQYPRAALH